MAGALITGIAISLLLRAYLPPNPHPVASPKVSSPDVPQPVQGDVGAPTQLSGYRITVISANPNAGRISRSDPDAPGGRVVTVGVRYENTDRRAVIVSPFDWTLIDSGGSAHSAMDTQQSTELPQETLGPGDTVEGTIQFAVDANASGLKLYFDSEIGFDQVVVGLE